MRRHRNYFVDWLDRGAQIRVE